MIAQEELEQQPEARIDTPNVNEQDLLSPTKMQTDEQQQEAGYETPPEESE